MEQSMVRDLSTPELQEKLDLETARLAKLRMAHAVTPLENPMELNLVRRGIARIKTELTKRHNQGEATKA